MIGGAKQAIQDPIFLLRQMGCVYLYDFRHMDGNLVRNVADPAITFGSEPATFLNGDFEAFTGGIADDWTDNSLTGTLSEETDLPWDSEGSSAQKMTGNTDNNRVVLKQTVTHEQARTYRLKFKVEVESGTLRFRVRKVSGGTTQYGWRDFTSADEAGEYYFYFVPWNGTSIQVELFNVGGSSLTFTVDDMTLEPLENDVHLTINANHFSSADWDGRSYDFTGSSGCCAANWRANAWMTFPNDEICLFSKTNSEYAATQSSCVQSIYRSDSLPGRVFIERHANNPAWTYPRLEFWQSHDGTVVNLMKEHEPDLLDGEIHSSVCYLDADTGDDDFIFDGESLGHIAYTPAPAFYDPAVQKPYIIGSFINASSNYGSAYEGKIYVAGAFDVVPSAGQLALIDSILRTI